MKTNTARGSFGAGEAPDGILLINLGSPDSPRPGDVRRYLREFLSDPRVIDIPAFARWLLLNLIILPLRPRKSGAAYQKIWTDRGSPLIAHSRDLTDAVAELLAKREGGRFAKTRVRLAMRYGNPSIADALAEFRREGVMRIRVLPLYPQYSTAATASSIARVFEVASEEWNLPAIEIAPPFFEHPGFLDPYARLARERLDQAEAQGRFAFDHYLFSFHGIPERHILKGNVQDHCKLNEACCEKMGPENQYCYRAHCYATARGMAERLKLPADKWSVSFQSRLGRTPWLRPYTDFELAELPARGVKNLAVFSPAFVADCLETLEELDMAGRETFREAGGENFFYVPCVNSDSDWAEGVLSILNL
ncbi:MAG: ferrochelatase [bacterium]|nr:ferrochelatase [bacterium]